MQVQAQLLPSNARVAASVMDALGKNIRLPTFPKPEHEGHRKVRCHSRASPYDSSPTYLGSSYTYTYTLACGCCVRPSCARACPCLLAC